MRTVEKVLYNPHTDKIGIGIRIRFMDKLGIIELDNMENYSIQLCDTNPDGWIIDNEEGVWLYCSNEALKDIVVIGEL